VLQVALQVALLGDVNELWSWGGQQVLRLLTVFQVALQVALLGDVNELWSWGGQQAVPETVDGASGSVSGSPYW